MWKEFSALICLFLLGSLMLILIASQSYLYNLMTPWPTLALFSLSALGFVGVTVKVLINMYLCRMISDTSMVMRVRNNYINTGTFNDYGLENIHISRQYKELTSLTLSRQERLWAETIVKRKLWLFQGFWGDSESFKRIVRYNLPSIYRLT